MEAVAKALTLRGVSNREMLKSLSEATDLTSWLKSIVDPLWVAILHNNYTILTKDEIRAMSCASIESMYESNIPAEVRRLNEVQRSYLDGKTSEQDVRKAWVEARTYHGRNNSEGWRWNLGYALVLGLDPFTPRIVPLVDQKGAIVKAWGEVLAEPERLTMILKHLNRAVE